MAVNTSSAISVGATINEVPVSITALQLSFVHPIFLAFAAFFMAFETF